MVRQPSLRERAIAEAVGTFLLVFLGCGAVASVGVFAHLNHRAITMADLLLIAFAFGLALFIIVMIVGKVSGAHVNPAVTIALASIGRFPTEEIPAYVVGQLIGALIGAACIPIVFGSFAAKYGSLGAPSLATNTNLLQGLIAEGLGTAILVITIVATAVDSRAPAGWAGLSIGLSLAVIIMFIGPATGSSVNPTRAIGPDIVNLFFGVTTDWGAYIVCYLIGPLLGGVGGAWLYAYFSRMPTRKAA
ncbi:MAG TPA: MIP/aquaporin family protein [Ktedonobacterales bacterium]|nr:MIP/aquaporin family protein [Ktedonobacterales bacterium]